MMTTTNTDAMAPRTQVRLWPGIVAVVLQWLSMLAVPVAFPSIGMFGVLGGLLLGMVVLVWWLFFSRAAWLERLGAPALMVLGVLLTSRAVHPSILNGMMGMMLLIYGIPVMSLALVTWAVATRGLPGGRRRASLLATVLIACGLFTVVRTSGVAGDGRSEFSWRWTPSPEERLLLQSADEPVAVAAPRPASPASAVTPLAAPRGAEAPGTAAAAAPAPVVAPVRDSVQAEPAPIWPGFRGPGRDGIVRGARIATDWTSTPPVQIWRRPIGPGWSSFAVSGDRLFTQEQRGDDEVVACYKVSTGETVWRHRDATRFWESNAGAGPRATPTLGHGRVYALGATGILNALNDRDGSVAWSRNVAAETNTKVPIWGFSASPIVVDDLVIVAAAGTLAAYDAATGTPRWTGTDRGGSYSSPHRATIGGVPQVVFLSGTGAVGLEPASGAVLWEHAWPGATIVQPSLTDDGDVLISTGGNAGGLGIRRLNVARAAGAWAVTERWTSTGLKPYFNDLVVYKGHAYGFDGSILACIDLADGRRAWKGGRYGYGQLLLLADQGLLLVLTEDGDVVLVDANPDQFKEVGRSRGVSGKTWNHPVLAGDTLLVRNGEEMAAFRLSPASR